MCTFQLSYMDMLLFHEKRNLNAFFLFGNIFIQFFQLQGHHGSNESSKSDVNNNCGRTMTSQA